MLLSVWTSAALYFDLPLQALQAPAALLYLVLMTVAMLFFRRSHKGLLIAVAGFVIVALWWFSLTPSNDRKWRADDLATPYAEIAADQITIHNVRNCNYRSETDYTCSCDTRSYDPAKLRGVDIFITWWGSPWIAHPVASYDFGDQGHVAISIETRHVVGQDYSSVRGFFRQYMLTYTVSDERDVIRLRTNYRKDEEVYLFRTTVKPEMARQIFVEYLQRANSLHRCPEWYNALTNNCTTNIAVSAAEAQRKRVRFDWRVLLNGKMDEMMYERGTLVTGGLSLPALKEQAHINAAAKAANDSSEFSKLIRQGRVGFTENASASGIRARAAR
ncbi:MAG: DUF4105 domain-containing protein [Bryobacteraceae bacterium]